MLLAILDQLNGRAVCDDAHEDEMAELLEAWTDGKYKLVAVTDSQKLEGEISRISACRAGHLDKDPKSGEYGINLYVSHIRTEEWKRKAGKKVNDLPDLGGGHWEGMVKRNGRKGGMSGISAKQRSPSEKIQKKGGKKSSDRNEEGGKNSEGTVIGTLQLRPFNDDK